MKRVAAVLVALTTSLMVTAGEFDVIWSPYSPALKLISFDAGGSTATFRGRLTLRGRLFFDFDLDGLGGVNGVLFARFVPDTESQRRLPAVIAGRYPSAIEQVWLNPPERVLDLAFGRARAQRLSHGREPTVFTNVEILISEFYVGIDCDSRTYAAKVVSLRQVKADLMLASNDPPSGC